jgi:hypothetical protein
MSARTVGDIAAATAPMAHSQLWWSRLRSNRMAQIRPKIVKTVSQPMIAMAHRWPPVSEREPSTQPRAMSSWTANSTKYAVPPTLASRRNHPLRPVDGSAGRDRGPVAGRTAAGAGLDLLRRWLRPCTGRRRWERLVAIARC